MDRTVGGIPLPYWAGALIAGVVGFMWFRKRATGSSSPATSTTGGTAFSQMQEEQDFQIFSALTSAQQGSDLNFLGQVASLFAGGSSTQPSSSTAPSGGGGSTSTVPAPPSTGTTAPATAATAKQPGYGLVNTAQGEMIWLGVNNPGSPIYNVGGGAPVYFGNAQALATGSQYEQAGYDIYTPASYANLVSANTSNLGAAYT